MPAMYSTRFIDAAAVNAWTVYSVPEGSLAVIRHVVGVNAGPASAYVFLALETYPVWVRQLSTPYGTLNEEMRLVCPGGTQFSVYTAEGVHVAVSGYLFSDVSGPDSGISGVGAAPEQVFAPMPAPGDAPGGLDVAALVPPDPGA